MNIKNAGTPIGIIRKVDHLGRIVIPIEMRRIVGIESETPVETFSANESIYIRKYDESRAYGIVRKNDALGRVVIPKEIRRAMNIGRGDSLALHMEDDMVVVRKYATSSKTLANAIQDAMVAAKQHPFANSDVRKQVLEHLERVQTLVEGESCDVV